ncbi:bifunctional phosphoserine phosphatase/homoserine phosphotransferase ThrH [Catonella massiliensis]|uniref:phosphoserine phosphatase n=1 Tax=Catonella massiliensis TaxID=2799636 RepID=A0ABS1IY31_9FIRM|nr:bifunctional phosphoserine phosphatase/homoserine phosphotransferase ThrH [Catonella massiliensis]MBK5896564.1 bifunctional phosphoserine phosphatase/homoserine phosphotransferase ThrH [Catonella massiliensis]
MNSIVCLDMEGVLIPEIWIEFAHETGIKELRLTTKDEPDYDKLMKMRIRLLKEHNYGIKAIQKVIDKVEPYEGAKEFLDELRSFTQVIILSDTYREFGLPVMKKLGYPTLFCHELEIADNGEITDYKLRKNGTKLETVRALQSIGFDTIAAGDSYNDLGMIRASKAGFLFRSPEKIKNENKDVKTLETYEELLNEIKNAISEAK